LRPGHITISVWFLSNGLGTGDNALVTKTRIGDPWSTLGGEQYTLFQVLSSGISGQLTPGWTEGGFNIKRNGNCVNGGIGWNNITQMNLLPGVLNWSYSSGVWINLIATYDGVIMKLYHNGFLSGSFTPSPGLIDNCSGGTLNFGRYWDTRNFFNGKIDDIGIWNRALTQQEITNLYNSQNQTPCSTSIINNVNINGCGFAVLSTGDTVNQSGTYLDTLLTYAGCDSIINQTVTIQNPTICNPVLSYVPTNGLVGWWGFNGNAQDGSGNGNHGTVNGATLTSDRFGIHNGAYSFDGLNDDIQIASLANFDFQKKVSISVWINVNNYPGIKYNIVSKCGNYIDAFTLDIAQNNLIFDLSTGWPNWLFYSSPFQWSVNNWYHIVSTFDFYNNIRKIYVNGQFHDSSNVIPAMINALTSNVVFGYFHNAPSSFNYQRYNGKLDDIGIWNRALTQQEITNLFNSQLPTQTSLCLPTITTNTPTSIGIDSVVIGGDILNDGGSSIVLRGVCYSTTPNPNMGNTRTEEGSGIGSFTSTLRNLSPSTTYYARSYAKNSQGVVVYGNEVTFTTSSITPAFTCGTSIVSDVDGNSYNTIQIGAQCWTQSNLKVSKYRNGDSIPTGLNNSDFGLTSSGTYAIYENDPVYDGLYGKLYNHLAVMDTRGLCPTGWHVPTDNEWSIMENFLGGSSVAAGALKSTTTQPTPGGWYSPNTGATNSSGFSAMPGGIRYGGNGTYGAVLSYGYWWSSSLFGSNFAWARFFGHTYVTIYRNSQTRNYGFSVRCLRD
jgi:uncharacterized protein (TIGR02145 family)